MKTHKEVFAEKGYVVVKGFIPKELAVFLHGYLCLFTRIIQSMNQTRCDEQVPDAFDAVAGDIVFEALMQQTHEKIQTITGLDLIPTYSYRRLYKNGNILKKHTDRPSCEISATIKLSDSGGYNWPIWMVDSPHELEDGDAVIYRGCDLEHWRDKCEGPDNYILGQVFTHYVDKNGPLSDYAYDKDFKRAEVFKSLLNGFLYQK
jgi:hypothetical protein